jgi:hypothetical protein
MSNALTFDDAYVSEPLVEKSPVSKFDGGEISTIGVLEMLLKNREGLDQLLRDEDRQRDLIPRLLAVSLIGFTIYGVIATALLNAFQTQSGMWLPYVPAATWNSWSAANLTLSFTLGLIAANGICLPSFYFYGLLAGIHTTMLGVTAHALKGMAAGAVALVGLLPIYAAAALTALVFPGFIGGAMFWSAFGLMLPFVAGLWGAFSLYQGFVGLADTMCDSRRGRRECFLRRLIFAWCGCFTFVTPVVIYSLWDWLADWTQMIGG